MWCQLQFGTYITDRTIAVNNLPIAAGYPATLWNSLSLKYYGFYLSGNPIAVNWIRAQYAATTNSTLAFDIYPHVFDPEMPYFWVGADEHGSQLTLLGDIIFRDNFWLTPNPVKMGVHNAGTVELRGAIVYTGSRPFRIDKEDTGSLIMSGGGLNSFHGLVSVSGGLLGLNRYDANGVGVVAVPGNLLIGTSTNPVASLVLLYRSHQIADTSAVEVYPSGTLNLNDNSDTIGSLEMKGGSVLTGSGTLTVVSDITVSPGAEASVISGNLNFANPLYPNAFHYLTVASSALLDVPAVIDGATNAILYKDWSGTLRLGGSNTFESHFLVAGGWVIVANPHALGNSNRGTLLTAGANLRLESVTVSNEDLTIASTGIFQGTGSSAWWGDVYLQNNSIVDAASGATFTLGGSVYGSGGFFKTGTGKVRLAGNATNTFSSSCVVMEGTLELAKTGGLDAVPGDLVIEDGAEVRVYNRAQISDTAQVTINGSGVLRLSNLVSRAESIGSLTGSGAVVLENSLFSVGGNNASTKFTGMISGNGNLTKEGTGILLLGSRTNTYSGSTTVAGGTLLVDAFQPLSDVTVSAQGILGGRGTVGDIALSGGRLAPGGSPGLLTCSNVTFSSSSKFDVELNGATVGSGYDQLRVRGAVSLGNSGLYVSVGFTPAVGTSFIIINNDGTEPVLGTFKGLTNGAALRSGLVELQINYGGGSGNNDVVLTVTKVNAPTSPLWLLAPTYVGTNLSLSWTGGAPAFIVERKTGLLTNESWQPVLTNPTTSATVPLDTNSGFYRVRGGN